MLPLRLTSNFIQTVYDKLRKKTQRKCFKLDPGERKNFFLSLSHIEAFCACQSGFSLTLSLSSVTQLTWHVFRTWISFLLQITLSLLGYQCHIIMQVVTHSSYTVCLMRPLPLSFATSQRQWSQVNVASCLTFYFSHKCFSLDGKERFSSQPKEQTDTCK